MIRTEFEWWLDAYHEEYGDAGHDDAWTAYAFRRGLTPAAAAYQQKNNFEAYRKYLANGAGLS